MVKLYLIVFRRSVILNFGYLFIVFSPYFVALKDNVADESRFHLMLVFNNSSGIQA